MIIALTGSSGSIGKEIIPFLQDLGHQIITISSSKPNDGVSNFSYADLISHSIEERVDIFVHLASLNARLDDDNFDQEVTLATNVMEAMHSLQCQKFIFFSTAKVYGDNSFIHQTFSELAAPKPTCSYGKAKLQCENLIMHRSETLNINTIIFRLPPVLNQFDSSNLGKLIQLSRSNLPMASLTLGEDNQRSFLSIVNIKEIMRAILKNPLLIRNNEIYNLADSNYISLNRLLRLNSSKYILILPKFVSYLALKIPLINRVLLKLYGNFVIENSKLQRDMGVKLLTTEQSLITISK
tara:strand:- start:83 stop:970 length:888 start_codon:yes stop_codon:yes gene_type:complete